MLLSNLGRFLFLCAPRAGIRGSPVRSITFIVIPSGNIRGPNRKRNYMSCEVLTLIQGSTLENENCDQNVFLVCCLFCFFFSCFISWLFCLFVAKGKIIICTIPSVCGLWTQRFTGGWGDCRARGCAHVAVFGATQGAQERPRP